MTLYYAGILILCAARKHVNMWIPMWHPAIESGSNKRQQGVMWGCTEEPSGNGVFSHWTEYRY